MRSYLCLASRHGVSSGLWLVLKPNAEFEVSSWKWYGVKKFRTKAQAEAWRFFVYTKYVDEFENIDLVVVRISERLGIQTLRPCKDVAWRRT